MQGKTVFVTGATGFLGGALARRLAADGARVKALARRPERADYIRDVNNIEIVVGDITSAERMQAVIPGCDVVFHVAAATGGAYEQQLAVNVDGTRNVMTAAAEAGVERAVHVSTISVYGFGYYGEITEPTPRRPGHDPYCLTKAEAEVVVEGIAERQGLAYSIIRPGMIYGPRSGAWTDAMFQLAKRDPTPIVGDGRGSAHPIYVDDVVDLTVTLATHPAAVGEAFNCAADPAPSWRDFLGAYADLANSRRWFDVPGSVLRPLAQLAALLAGEHTTAKDLPDMLQFVTSETTFRMDKARDLLGWEAQVSLDEGIRRCVPYLQQKGLLA
jgi:nucleoside-diphosphate-sugar epimerase